MILYILITTKAQVRAKSNCRNLPLRAKTGLPQLATLLKEASSRTQLFITTHSDVLVDELTDVPGSILVCNKEDGSTSMKRLSAEQLKEWLEKYTLGELWRKGEIGGNRW